jgi:uncharacterized low-complexity protein
MFRRATIAAVALAVTAFATNLPAVFADDDGDPGTPSDTCATTNATQGTCNEGDLPAGQVNGQ